MRVKEIRRFNTVKVNRMCVDNSWYTKGSVEDYDRMMSMCRKDHITTSQLYKIAKDIYEHTDVNNETIGCGCELSDEENILNMMIYINDCTYTCFIIEGKREIRI